MNDLWKKLLLISVCLCFFSSVAYAMDGRGKDMLFYPTDVSKAGDFSYLQDSVRLMLASRLAALGGVQPHFKKNMKDGQTAPYEVRSRLVQNKERVELDVSVLFAEKSATPVAFHAEAKDATRLMKALDMVVADIDKSFFGGKAVVDTFDTEESNETSKINFRTPHPDRMVRRNHDT